MNIYRRVARLNRCHLLLALLLLGLFLFLVERANEEYHWSYWGFGDAQTMLTLNQWEKGGWLNNYLLFKPQGWAPVVDLLDTPELRHHAHGISPASSPRVGPRLWYTHYPPGYLIPYAAIYHWGITSLFGLQIFSIGISLAALLFMYLAFSRLTDCRVALVAVAFYGCSTLFLGYADSLANMPIDDLLRFGFMLTVILSTRSRSWRNGWLAVSWLLQFLLSLASFDSVFFLYIWLVGWDLLEGNGWRWKKWLLYALAPILAHSLQFWQNVWYLGWREAGIDIMDTFLGKSSSAGLGDLSVVQRSRVEDIAFAFLGVFYSIFSPGLVLLAPLAFYLAFRRLYPYACEGLPGGRLLVLLFCCGLGFILVLPGASGMAYEGRQMIPFVSLMVGGYFWSVIRGKKIWMSFQSNGVVLTKGTAQNAFLGVSGVLLFLFLAAVVFNNRYPSPWQIEEESIEEVLFVKELDRLATVHDPVFLLLGGIVPMDQDYADGANQLSPDIEYYAGSRLILSFDTPESLAADLIFLMKNKGSARFSPVLVSDQPEKITEAVSLLTSAGLLDQKPKLVKAIRGRYVLDVTPYQQIN